MAKQIQKKVAPKEEAVEAATLPSSPSEEEKAAKAAQDQELDALLDEIDGVLEKNSASFVKNYIQKGGE